MKKFAALFLALVMALAGVAAMAEAQQEAQEPVEVNWSDVEPNLEAAGLTGDFYSYDYYGLQFWIPSEMVQQTLTDEQKEQNWVDLYVNDDQSLYMVMEYQCWDGSDTLEDIAAEVADKASDTGIIKLNGLDALVIDHGDGERRQVIIPTDVQYYYVSFTYTGIDHPEYVSAITASMASIMPITEG